MRRAHNPISPTPGLLPPPPRCDLTGVPGNANFRVTKPCSAVDRTIWRTVDARVRSIGSHVWADRSSRGGRTICKPYDRTETIDRITEQAPVRYYPSGSVKLSLSALPITCGAQRRSTCYDLRVWSRSTRPRDETQSLHFSIAFPFRVTFSRKTFNRKLAGNPAVAVNLSKVFYVRQTERQADPRHTFVRFPFTRLSFKCSYIINCAFEIISTLRSFFKDIFVVVRN